MSNMDKIKEFFGLTPPGSVEGFDDDYVDEYSDVRSPRERREPRGGGYGSGRGSSRPVEEDYDSEAPYYDDEEPPVRGRYSERRAARGFYTGEQPDRGDWHEHGARAPRMSSRSAGTGLGHGPAALGEPERTTRIVTVRPTEFEDAGKVGEPFREGAAVVVDLRGAEGAEAKRVFDFATGAVFAVRGSMEKLAGRVFLLLPARGSVSDADRRRIERDLERGAADQ